MEGCTGCGCDKKTQSIKNVKRLSANLPCTNTKMGHVLQDVGYEVGDENLWHEKWCCQICWQLLGRWNTSRRILLNLSCQWKERTGGRELPKITIEKKLKRKRSQMYKDTLLKYIRDSHYKQALRYLKLHNSAHDWWLLDLKKTIRHEMKCLQWDRTLFSASENGDGSGAGDWDVVLDKIKSRAPTLYTAFYAAISTSDKSRRPQKKFMKNRMGLMFLIPLHHRKPRYHRIPRYLPLTLASTVWKCSQMADKMPRKALLRRFGFSLHPPVNKSRNTVTSWKTAIEDEKTATDNETLLAGENMDPGYSLIMDSVSRKSHDSDYPVCNAFAVKNRVSFRELQEDTTVKASDLPLKIYLPSQKDYEELRMRMRVLVERILKANLEVFSHQSTLEHIPHQYSKECSKKSAYVNLGAIEDQENPNDPEGMLKILTNLSKLVPEGYDMPLHGDHETLTAVGSARKTASLVPSSKNHIHQLHPVPQDLRAVIVRDTIAELFTPTQATEKGTLKHLKEKFDHRKVNEDVSYFKSTDDFLLFIACAFVVAFASEIIRKPKSRSKPRLAIVADEIVRRIWYQVPMNTVADIMTAPVEDYDDQFCFCKQDLEEAEMIECCNIDCPNGRWFHHECVMDVEAEGEWFCSPHCEQSNMGQFCVCRQKGEEGTDLTWSCANKSCQRGAHFHNRCVRSTLPVPQDEDWYCSAECAKKQGNEEERDEFLDYLQRVTWCSLFSECIRDAEREGDGTASMGYWRISMPEMFARGHDRHVAATHRLLAGTSGCFPPRIREEVIHNRTINLHGGKGKNISLNFLTDQLNNLKVAEAPSKTQGNKNPKSKQKGGKSSSKLSDSIQRFARYHEDVKKFLYNFGDTFCEMKGRIIPSLCNKTVGQEITQEKAASMKNCLLKLNKKFDKEMMKYHHGR